MPTYQLRRSVGSILTQSPANEWARCCVLLKSLLPSTYWGWGVVRDAFSEMLSPGTSTIQTRLRYFIFLPWIFESLERQHVSGADFVRLLREAEARLIDCLRHLGSGQGVIGYAAGRDLKRMPSGIYWGGLGAWRIRRLDLSLTDYAQRAVALGRRQPERDDDGNATRRAISMWAAIPPPPDDFLQRDITFELCPDEAQVLVDCIRRHHPDTLLAVLCGMPSVQVDVAYPWDLPTHGLPDRLIEVLRHARCFSELTVGPQLVYNVLLAQEAKVELGWDTDALEADQLEQVKSWVQLIDDRHEELRLWVEDLEEFWRVLDGPRCRLPHPGLRERYGHAGSGQSGEIRRRPRDLQTHPRPRDPA